MKRGAWRVGVTVRETSQGDSRLGPRNWVGIIGVRIIWPDPVLLCIVRGTKYGAICNSMSRTIDVHCVRRPSGVIYVSTAQTDAAL